MNKSIRSTILILLTPALLNGATWAQDQRLTAREVITRIQQHVGVPWQSETVDTFKAGNPDTPVTGIAVTMMATLDVLQRASANGQNFVITHEPTFYNHLDVPEGMDASDPVLKEKRDFIEKHGMVVWRFHDHWHRRKPDGILAGMPWGGRNFSRKRIRICSRCRRLPWRRLRSRWRRSWVPRLCEWWDGPR